MMLPKLPLPVADTNPPVDKLPKLAEPETVNVPVTFALVSLITKTLATPLLANSKLPLATGIEMFDVPLDNLDVLIVDQTKLPLPLVCRY